MKKQRFILIDILRTLAIYVIMAYHVNPSYPVIPGYSALVFGVWICFAISGFLIGYLHGGDYETYRLSDSITFVKNKLKRFYPLHIILFLFTLVLLLTGNLENNSVADSSPMMTGVSAVLNVLLLQSYAPQKSVYFAFNGPSWFLSTSMTLYFLSPWFISKMSKLKTTEEKFCSAMGVFAIGVCVAIGAAFLLDPSIDFWMWYVSPIGRVFEFFVAILMGMLFAQSATIKELMTKRVFLIAAVCAVLMAAYLVFGSTLSFLFKGMTLLSILLVLGAALLSPIAAKLNNSRIVTMLCGSSFELFLVHCQVLRIFKMIAPPGSISRYIAFPLCCVCCIVTGIIVKHLSGAITIKKKKK